MNTYECSVRVVDDAGDPVRNVKVACTYGVSNYEEHWTDSDGWVTFSFATMLTPPAVGVMFHVEGDEHGPYDVDDGDTFSFTR